MVQQPSTYHQCLCRLNHPCCSTVPYACEELLPDSEDTSPPDEPSDGTTTTSDGCLAGHKAERYQDNGKDELNTGEKRPCTEEENSFLHTQPSECLQAWCPLCFGGASQIADQWVAFGCNKSMCHQLTFHLDLTPSFVSTPALHRNTISKSSAIPNANTQKQSWFLRMMSKPGKILFHKSDPGVQGKHRWQEIAVMSQTDMKVPLKSPHLF